MPDDVAVVGFDDIPLRRAHRAAADHGAPADARRWARPRPGMLHGALRRHAAARRAPTVIAHHASIIRGSDRPTRELDPQSDARSPSSGDDAAPAYRHRRPLATSVRRPLAHESVRTPRCTCARAQAEHPSTDHRRIRCAARRTVALALRACSRQPRWPPAVTGTANNAATREQRGHRAEHRHAERPADREPQPVPRHLVAAPRSGYRWHDLRAAGDAEPDQAGRPGQAVAGHQVDVGDGLHQARRSPSATASSGPTASR